jgi:hypothetical protein
VPSPEPAPVVIAHVRLGRFYCRRCNTYGTVVRDAGVEIVCCPSCGEPAIPTSGYDDQK